MPVPVSAIRRSGYGESFVAQRALGPPETLTRGIARSQFWHQNELPQRSVYVVGIRYTNRYMPVTPVTSVTGVIMDCVISALLNKKTTSTHLRTTNREPDCGARIDARTIPIEVRTRSEINCDRCQRSDSLKHDAAFTPEGQTADAEYVATTCRPPRSRKQEVDQPNIARGGR
jgi:hypothetical protein